VNPRTDRLTTFAGTGAVEPFADGGPAATASLQPSASAVDHSGNLVIGDTLNDVIRMVAGSTGTFYDQAMTAGNIYTVAGTGIGGFSGDGGPATSAELFTPGGVAVDTAGNLLFADGNNNRIREVAG